ncbi:ribonuclease R [Alkalibacterium olivapovliticus]|uniref:Ribonuclease R n=1 Tax=Alkalibacterium olivapovliticus TaxID=99907 RepID=A0A2T0W7F3_9LACT|nr:ribonuclease R [Alkalibacterium olivapovliticus]PRY82632.1 ribonuclease R [Alkalibacterium olivapovliticus]
MGLEKETESAKRELKKQILAFMTESSEDAVEVNEISEGLDRSGSKAFTELVQAIAELEREDKLVLLQSGKFKLKDASTAMQGRFSGTDRGFGFVTLEEYESDIFIPPSETHSALNGDIVKVEVTQDAIPAKDKGPAGKVVEIIERGTTVVFGEFQPYSDDEVAEMGLYGFITPHNQKLPNVLVQIEAKGIRPVEGSIVQVELTEYSDTTAGTDLKGIVTNTIGHKDEPGIEILTIVHKYDIPTEFSEDVLKEAEAVPDKISEEDTKGRKDLRNEPIITIDGADAKDLDDAIQVKKLDNGHYYLGVHIADVSHYVTEDSAMDLEANERGTSVYLTDRVIPMLPQRLSNGICSLHPHVDRLTLSCEMEIDANGDVVDYSISPTIINNHHRMTYTAVNEILMEDNQDLKEEYSDILGMLEQMRDLHNTLEKKRVRRGSIDFDTREAKIQVDPQGIPVDILLRDRGVGERLIESFMLAANETVSEHFANQQLPILYRIHDRPDEGKMQRFIEFVSSFGIDVKATKESITPKLLQDVLDKVHGKPEEGVIGMLLLRSMQQAKYDVVPIGHYGLAADYYSHFTSPIRRYPDLILHRLVHYYNEVDKSQTAKNLWAAKLPDIAESSSITERRAVSAERETDELKKSEYMLSKIGETFKGVITSVTNFGMFVQLENTVEGLVHISNMTDDYYEFNERDMLMIGQRTGMVFRIGERVEVKVIGSDTDNYKIDFELVADESKKPEKSKQNDKKKSKGRSRGGNKGGKGPRGKHPAKGKKHGRDKPKGDAKGQGKKKKPGKKRK